MKKNTAGQFIGAQMINATDGSAFTGAVTVFVTKDNGTQTQGTVGGGTAAHKGNGYHSYAPSDAETNADQLAWTFVGTGAITTTVQVFTTFPQTADHTAAIADIPTVAEFNARTLVASSYFDPAADTVANVTTAGSVTGSVGSIAGVTFPTNFGDLAIELTTGYVSANVVEWNNVAITDPLIQITDITSDGSPINVTTGVVDTVTTVTTANAVGTDGISAASIAADAVAEIQTGLATQTSVDLIPKRDDGDSYRQIRDAANAIQQEIRETITSTEQNP